MPEFIRGDLVSTNDGTWMGEVIGVAVNGNGTILYIVESCKQSHDYKIGTINVWNRISRLNATKSKPKDIHA